mgnify:CR=1 FL=1
MLVQLRQPLGQRAQVLGVFAAIGQAQITVAFLLANGEVFGAMQGQGEHIRVAAQNKRGAVALVHVQIHHGHLQRSRLRRKRLACKLDLHLLGGHRNVVENAEPTALVWVSVVN